MSARAFKRMTAPIGRRVANMLARAIVTRVDDALKVQGLQLAILADETADGVEHFQPYGLTSVPHAGAEAVVAFVGGLRSHGITLAVADRRYRLTALQGGEVALYDDLGQKLHLTRDGIAITSALKVEVTAPAVTVVSDNVNLGAEGGPPVARVGDPVVGGVITAGSGKVRAA